MPTQIHNKRNRFRNSPPDESAKRVWIIYASEANLDFFNRLGDGLISKYQSIDVSIIYWRPYIKVKSISTEELLFMSSDFIIYDATYMLEVGMRISNTSKRSCIFYLEENNLNGCFTGEINHDICFSYNKNSSQEEINRLIQSIDNLQKRRIFICHAGEDNYFARRLSNELCKAGMAVWYDKWSLNIGDSIVEKINEGIKETDFLAIILSQNSVMKPWCLREMNSALQRQLDNRGITVLPILIEDCDIPPLYSDIIWADFRGSFTAGMKSLLRTLRLF